MSKRKSSGVNISTPAELVMPPVEGAQESLSGGEPAAPEPIQSSGQLVTMYAPDGTAQQVDAAQAPELYRQQKLGFAEGQKINVTKGGKVFEFTPDKLDAAFDNGYRVASEHEVEQAKERKEFSGVGKTAEALGLGAARGLTFGLSDPLAIGAAGLVSPEAKEATRRELRLSKEHHPIASVAGEVAGAIAPVVISGGGAAAGHGAHGAAEGGSLLGRAIRGAGFIPRGAAALGEGAEHLAAGIVGHGAESLAGKVLQRAIPSAIKAGTEGAIFGAGAAVSEAALGDEELTAEKLLAGATTGFKMGAIAGGVLGGGYEVGKAAVDKGLKLVGKEGLHEFLSDVANSQTMRALGANARDIKNLGGMTHSVERAEERIGEIAETVRGYKFDSGKRLFESGTTTSKLADNLSEAVEETGRKLGAFRNKVSELSKADVSLAPDVKGFFQQLDEQIFKPAGEAGGTLAKRAKVVESEFATLRGKIIPAGIPEGHPLSEIYQQSLVGNEQAAKMISRAAELDPAVAKMVTPEPVSIEELNTLRANIDKILFPKKVMGIQPPPAEHYAELLQARQLLEQTIENTTDNVVKLSGNPEMEGVYQTLKSQYRNLADAKAIAAAADMRAMTRNTASLSDKMAGGAVLTGALARGVGGPQAMLASAAAGMANKLVNERANSVIAAAADKMSKLVAMQKAVHASDHHIAEGLNAFLGEQHELHHLAHQIEHTAFETGKTALEVKHHAEHAAEHAEHAETAAQLATDPHAMATHVVGLTASIAEHAPGVATHVQEKATQVAQNIAAESPQGHHSAETLIPAKAPTPSEAQAYHAKLYRAVAEGGPEHVIKAMNEGRLTPTHVRALEANYPKWAAQIKQQILTKVAERGGALPYEKRKQLGLLLGVPVDGTQTPQFKQSIQSIYQPKQQQQQSGSPKRAASRPVKHMAEHSLTHSQSLNFE